VDEPVFQTKGQFLAIGGICSFINSRKENVMIEQLVEMLRAVEENDELFDIMARMMKKSYDALVKAGFTEEQAIKIVAGQGTGVKTS